MNHFKNKITNNIVKIVILLNHRRLKHVNISQINYLLLYILHVFSLFLIKQTKNSEIPLYSNNNKKDLNHFSSKKKNLKPKEITLIICTSYIISKIGSTLSTKLFSISATILHTSHHLIVLVSVYLSIFVGYIKQFLLYIHVTPSPR